MQSLKLEHKLYTSVKIKMEEMQQHNMSWIEVCKSLIDTRLRPLIPLVLVSGSIFEEGR